MKLFRRIIRFQRSGGERARRGEVSPEYYKALSDWIARAETKTSAELVVVFRRKSGDYRDIDYLVGAAFGWLALLLILFLPVEFLVYTIPIEVAFFFVLGSWLSPRLGLRYRLSRRRRRSHQVRTGARASLVDEGVLLTRENTGVLVYWSWFERQVEILADIGVQKAVAPEDWNACLFHFRHMDKAKVPLEAFLSNLTRLEEVLAKHLPPRADNPDELPNRPRIYL